MPDNSVLSATQYKEIVRWLFEDVWTKGKFGEVSKHIASRMTFHFRGRTSTLSPDDLIEIVTRWRTAFPDFRFEIGAIVVEQDLTAVRLIHRGTHQGTWRGIAPTGRQIEVDEMMFLRFEDGRICEVWEVTDEYLERQQLLPSET